MSDTLREIESIIRRAIFSESREAAFALRDSAVAAIEQIESERDEAKGNLEAWRFHADAWGTDPDEVRKYIKRVEAERDAYKELLASEKITRNEIIAKGVKMERELGEARKGMDALQAELERERMRLVACGVVAGANTEMSAAAARDMHPDYWTEACADVARAVDREMQLRAEVELLKADKARLDWLEKLDPDSSSWLVVIDSLYIRGAIDSAMKGEAK